MRETKTDSFNPDNSPQEQYTPARQAGPATLLKRIDSTNYRVRVHFSDASRETHARQDSAAGNYIKEHLYTLSHLQKSFGLSGDPGRVSCAFAAGLLRLPVQKVRYATTAAILPS